MTSLYKTALSELEGVFDRLNAADVDKAVDMIASARSTVVFGGGRERLQIMGFAMRLYHLGLKVAVEGDMTTPPVGEGDLFIVTVGPDEISTALALASRPRPVQRTHPSTAFCRWYRLQTRDCTSCATRS